MNTTDWNLGDDAGQGDDIDSMRDRASTAMGEAVEREYLLPESTIAMEYDQ